MLYWGKSIIASARKRVILPVSVLALFAVNAPAGAQVFESVELFLWPSEQTVQVGETVALGLVVRSLNALEVPLSGLDAILDWDPGAIELLGRVDNGPYTWAQRPSGFPDDSAIDCLNCEWSDGDALYRAVSRILPDPPGIAPPSDTEGLLVTTFVFEALATTTGTIVSMPLTAGQYSRTLVVPGSPPPGRNILDSVTPATITIIVPEPASVVLLLSAAMLVFRRRS